MTRADIDWIVVDVEIQKTIEETPGGWDATDKLGVACACVWEFASERMRIYGPDDVKALQERLHEADRISGYNIWKFDFPVIFGLPGRERVESLRSTCDDLLRRIWKAKNLDPDTFTADHKGWGLDAVCGSTLGRGKIGYGGDAPKWFQAGQWARVANYCADDVALERDLTLFIDKYGFIANSGVVLQIAPW
jgi:DEAD/DEAH box helicase domain-containing protein